MHCPGVRLPVHGMATILSTKGPPTPISIVFAKGVAGLGPDAEALTDLVVEVVAI